MWALLSGIMALDMNRRAFLAALSAGAVITASGLWIPGQKLISIPKKLVCSRYFGVSWHEHPISHGLGEIWTNERLHRKYFVL